jgi:hypothetical protein
VKVSNLTKANRLRMMRKWGKREKLTSDWDAKVTRLQEKVKGTVTFFPP